MNKRIKFAMMAVAGMISTTPVMAQNIQGPSKITATANPILGNGTSRFPISEMVDGNSSDADPFNGYQASNGRTGIITLTLDQAYDLTSFYLWNDINVRAEGVQNYRLRFYDANNNVIGPDVTGLTTNSGQVAPHITNFSKLGVKRVDLIVDSVRTTTSIRRVEIREVAFQGAPARAPQAEAYRCYDLMGHRGKETNKRFTMVDQFGQSRTVIGHPVQLCNPVALNKRGATPANMAKQYKDHLVCYEIFDVDGRQTQQNVQIQNKLETNNFITGHADQICMISSKRHNKETSARPSRANQSNARRVRK